MANPAQERIDQQLESIQNEFGKKIVAVLKETNKSKLAGKGKIAPQPKMDRHSLRWTLEWQEGPISFDLNVVVSVEDNGRFAQVNKVLVHRHATADYNFEGHTPTTRMRRLTSLSIKEIQEAIEVELK